MSEVVFSPSSTSGPQQLALRLDPGQASLYVVASCCTYNYYPTSKVRCVDGLQPFPGAVLINPGITCQPITC